MFCPQPLHQHPSLGNSAHRDARKPTLPCCAHVASWVDCGPRAFAEGLAAGLLLDAGSALTKGGQVMFCPQPLHQLPSLGNCAHRCTQASPALLYRILHGWLQYNCWMLAAPEQKDDN